MFARAVAALGTPDYRPHGLLHRLGGWYGHVGAGASMFASVLVAEEATDRLQREVLHDERVQPLLRAVSRVHVVEAVTPSCRPGSTARWGSPGGSGARRRWPTRTTPRRSGS